MGKAKAPPPPDYKGMAEATTASNADMLDRQTVANRPNIETPWGKQTWTQTRGEKTGSAFDEEAYLKANPDVMAAIKGGKSEFTSGEMHYARHGRGEGRAASYKDTYGPDSWTQNIELSPEQQRALDSEMRIKEGRSSAAEGLIGQATDAFKTPFNWGDLPARSGAVNGERLDTTGGRSAFGFGGSPGSADLKKGINGDYSAYRDRAQKAVEDLQAPDLQRRRAAEETRLANQGFASSSEAYDADMQDVSDNETRAQLMAIQTGRQEADSMFGQDMSLARLNNDAESTEFNQDLATGQFENQRQGQDFGQDMARRASSNAARTGNLSNDVTAGNFNNNNRTQQIIEQMQRRGMTLNELNALLSGQQVNMPSFNAGTPAGKVAGTDFSGAADSQYNAALGGVNAQNAQTGQTTAALGSAAAMAAAFFM